MWSWHHLSVRHALSGTGSSPVQIYMINCTQLQLGASFVTAISTISSSMPFNSSESNRVLTDQAVQGDRVSKLPIFRGYSGNNRISESHNNVTCRQAQLQQGHEDYQSVARREQREQEKRRVDQARDAERKTREEARPLPFALPHLRPLNFQFCCYSCLKSRHIDCSVCLAGLPALFTRAYLYTCGEEKSTLLGAMTGASVPRGSLRLLL